MRRPSEPPLPGEEAVTVLLGLRRHVLPGSLPLQASLAGQSILPPPGHPGLPASRSSHGPARPQAGPQLSGAAPPEARVPHSQEPPPTCPHAGTSVRLTLRPCSRGAPPPSPCPSSFLQPRSSLGSPPPLTPEDDSQVCVQWSQPPAHRQCSEACSVGPEPPPSSPGSAGP